MQLSYTFFNQINKTSLYLAIFLTPLFFLPFAQHNFLGYPKQIFLLFFVFLSLFSLLIKNFIQEKIVFKESKLIYLFLLIFISFLFSTIFSVWPKASLWGLPLSSVDNFVAFFTFFLLVLVFINTIKNEKDLYFSIYLLIFSSSIVGIISLLHLYGIFFFPFDFFKDKLLNPLGSIYQTSIFLSALLPVALVMSLNYKKLTSGIFFLFLFISIILIDFNPAWFCFLLGFLILIFFGLAWPKGKINFVLAGILMLALIIPLFFLFFPLRFNFSPSLPPQVSLGFAGEFDILKGVYSQGIKDVFLGTGPGTFVFDYSRYRSPFLNQNFFWGVRFSAGASEFLDWFVSKGIIGGFSLFIFVFLLIYFNVRNLSKTNDLKDNSIFQLKLGLLSSMIALLGAGLVSSFDFSLWFLFWFVSGCLLFFITKERVLSLTNQKYRFIFSIISLTLIVVNLFFVISQGQKYLAEVNYAKAMMFSERDNIDEAIKLVQKAILLNPSVDSYWRDLSRLYLINADLISQETKFNQEEKNRLIKEQTTNSLDALNRAIGIAPFNVANWNFRGFFYRSFIGVPNADNLALESYKKASELEPFSPFPYGEIGRIYILMAQDFNSKGMTKEKEEALSQALVNLERSIKLKPDYATANYLIAVVYDQLGKADEAIKKLERIKNSFPKDIGISFQLGMIYWRNSIIDKAEEEFKNILMINPQYSNALYMLGLIYDQQGDKEKSKDYFKKVADLNPDNKEVKKIMENLEKGLPALEGLILGQPPIEEKPLEIKK